jgi:hypothetical protein
MSPPVKPLALVPSEPEGPAAKAARLTKEAADSAGHALDETMVRLCMVQNHLETIAALNVMPAPIRDRSRRLAEHIAREVQAIAYMRDAKR